MFESLLTYIKRDSELPLAMLHKISRDRFLGGGSIKILYPGAGIYERDAGIGSIGRIDHPETRGNNQL